MFTKTKIALAAVLVAATSSVAFAQAEFVWSLANGYPASSDPIGGGVVIQQGTTGYADPFEVDRADRASSPYAGGN